MLARAELTKRLVLEWVGLEDVPQRIDAVGNQAFKIEGDLGSTVVEPAQLRRAAAGPEAVGGHPRRQAFLEIRLLLREQRDDEGLARLRGMRGGGRCHEDCQSEAGRDRQGSRTADSHAHGVFSLAACGTNSAEAFLRHDESVHASRAGSREACSRSLQRTPRTFIRAWAQRMGASCDILTRM